MHGKCELSFKDIEWGVFRKYALCIMLDNGLGLRVQGIAGKMGTWSIIGV
jgi:hypothetical protein